MPQPGEIQRTIVVTKPLIVEAKIKRLGLSMALLEDVRLAHAAASASTTVFEPCTAAGSKGWFAAVGTLRERLAETAWEPRDIRCWPASVAPSEDYAITVASGDQWTGTVVGDRQPTTKNPKGITVKQAIGATRLQLAFPYLKELRPIRPVRVRARDVPPTWFLLLLDAGDELRAEVSLPDNIDGPWITHWNERIILPKIERQRGPGLKRNSLTLGDAPELDVPVERR